MEPAGLNLARALDPNWLLLGFAFGVVVALVTMIYVAVTDKAQREFILKLFEAIIATAVCAILARAFLSVLVSLGGDRWEAVALCWHLFLGVFALIVDVIAIFIGAETAFSPEPLLWGAFIAGGILGLYDGLYRTRDWFGWGIPTLILDVTWGLALTAHGSFMLVFNRFFGKREGSPRENEHLFSSGFRILPSYAFTQGAVISNWTVGQAKLLEHERIHVLQNRIFGPLFLFYYVFWLIPFGALGLLTDIIGSLAGLEVLDDHGNKRPITFGDALMWYPYYNNPWEFWAYQYGGHRDPAQLKRLRWPGYVIIGLAVVTVPIALYLLYTIVSAAYGWS